MHVNTHDEPYKWRLLQGMKWSPLACLPYQQIAVRMFYCISSFSPSNSFNVSQLLHQLLQSDKLSHIEFP